MPSLAHSLIKRLAARQTAKVCTIQRATPSVDNGGGVVRTWADHLTNVPVTVQFLSGSEGLRYGAESNRKFGRAYVEGQLDITAEDRMTWNSRTFDIQSVINPGEFTAGQSVSHMILEIEETSEDSS